MLTGIALLAMGLALDQIATAAVTFGALMFAITSWRANRREASFDRFYERLDRPNEVLARHECARVLMDDAWVGGRPEGEFERRMVVFAELDNLEYAIEKFRLGYMTPENALRAARTFQSRCRNSAKFRQLVPQCVKDFGYKDLTRSTALKVAASCDAEAAMTVSRSLCPKAASSATPLGSEDLAATARASISS
jgi:hypothetical protein